MEKTISARFLEIQEQVENQIKSLSYNQPVEIVAVSKKQPIDKIQEALESGHRHFGENFLQDAENKWPHLKTQFADAKLHFIGHIQSNKVKQITEMFDVVETIDRKKIAKAFADEMEKQQKNLKFYIQVNTGNEEQKSGVSINELEDLYNYCVNELKLHICGLMVIPPADEYPGPHFALLKKLAKQLGLDELSMGMSEDFEEAIQFGATSVRIGTKLFGIRES